MVDMYKGGYGSRLMGFLRSELDNSTLQVSNVLDLNKAGVVVGVVTGSTFQQWAISNIPLVTLTTVAGLEDGLSMISKRQIHAFLHDASDLFSWLNKTRSNCTTCSVGLFGSTTPYGSFISNSIEQISLASSVHSLFCGFIFMLLCLIVLQH